MHLPLGLPSHLSYPYHSKQQYKKEQQEQVTKKFSKWKQAHVRWNPKNNQTIDGNDSSTLSHHPYILWHSSWQLCTPQNSLHALSLFIRTKWTRYSVLFTPLSSIDPYLPCSPAIKFHNINSNIPYRPSTAHALQSFCIQARQAISATCKVGKAWKISFGEWCRH